MKSRYSKQKHADHLISKNFRSYSELRHALNVLQNSFLHRLLQRQLTFLISNLTQQVTQLLLAPDSAPGVPLVLNAT